MTAGSGVRGGCGRRGSGVRLGRWEGAAGGAASPGVGTAGDTSRRVIAVMRGMAQDGGCRPLPGTRCQPPPNAFPCLVSPRCLWGILRFSLHHCAMPSTDVIKSLWAQILTVTTATKFDINSHCLETKEGWCLRLEVENQSFT